MTLAELIDQHAGPRHNGAQFIASFTELAQEIAAHKVPLGLWEQEEIAYQVRHEVLHASVVTAFLRRTV